MHMDQSQSSQRSRKAKSIIGIKQDLESSNPFKMRHNQIQIANNFKAENFQQSQNLHKQRSKSESKSKNQQLQSSNPFKMRLKQIPISDAFKLPEQQPTQIGVDQINMKKKETFQEVNPFKITVNSMQNSNPFKIDLGQNGKQGFFFGDQSPDKSDQIFNNIIAPNNKKSQQIMPYKQLLDLPKLKAQSKLQSSHFEQNIKKYKQVLKFFYNNKYHERARNFEQEWKRYKKQGSSSQSLSQQLRKPEIFFKATRLIFTKQLKSKPTFSQKLQEYYLASIIERKHLIVYELRQPHAKSLKPILITINDEGIASCVEYDLTYGRIFYFSNTRQEIVVVGVKSRQLICRLKVKYARTNPILYIYRVKGNLYLLVVGGYRSVGEATIEGTKYIQIFSIQKWQISLKQVVLRLGIGRINPIIFSWDYEGENSVFIIGGSSNATISQRKGILFNVDQDINFSTNQTGVRIDSSIIQDCFMGDEPNGSLLINNINVRFDNPLLLYGGSVLFRRLPKLEKTQLFLPHKKQIFTIKIIKNDVHIIQSELAVRQPLSVQEDGALHKSITYHRDQKNSFQLYGIESDGALAQLEVGLSQRGTDNQDSHCRIV